MSENSNEYLVPAKAVLYLRESGIEVNQQWVRRHIPPSDISIGGHRRYSTQTLDGYIRNCLLYTSPSPRD